MSPRNSSHNASDHRWLRSSVDLAICFVIAVMVLRAFVLEGYLISTGSMAPGLLGFHRRLECPACGFSFAYGVAFDESAGPGLAGIRDPAGERSQVTCPNCGRNRIDISQVPNSHGDQLLVLKHVFDLRPPRRWETVVFRNPASPGEAYVKRVTGLPGEAIRIHDGDIFVNGRIARKDWNEQRSCRIPMSDLKHLVDDEAWQLPWELDEGWTADDAGLRSRGQALAAQGKPANATAAPGSSTSGSATSALTTSDSLNPSAAIGSSAAEKNLTTSWLRFRYWRWFGGKHLSETPLSTDDAIDFRSYEERFDSMPITWMTSVAYDPNRQVLRCRGVMPDHLQEDLLKHSSRDGFRNAVYRLAALSHLAPVTDLYGYNAMVDNPEYVVSDLMLKTTLSWRDPPAAVYVNLPLGSDTYRVVLRPRTGIVQLLSLDRREVVSEARVSLSTDSAGITQVVLEVSNFDRQILVALDGVQVMEPYAEDYDASLDDPFEFSLSTPTGQPVDAVTATRIALRHEQQKRWAIGVAELPAKSGDAPNEGVSLTDLEIFRDVFYTPGRRRNGVKEEFVVPEGSYFVQGDNSPVSSDSRSWNRPAVPHHLLLGKPFVVHLPSRPAVLEFGGYRWPIRVPDWKRIRYIR